MYGGQLSAGFVERPAEGADQHEQGPDGDAEQRADGDAAEGGAVGLGDQVALDDGLVGGVALQVVEEAVEGEDQDGGLGEIRARCCRG